METATLTKNKKRNFMTTYHLGGVIFGAIMTAFISATEKIMMLMESVTIINPDVKQFALDIYPFIAVFIGLATLILLSYRIKKTKKEIKKLDDK